VHKFDGATETKLELFENYLKQWLPTFLYGPQARTINIVDFFAGCGKDDDGNPGSPFRILRVIDVFKIHIRRTNSLINVMLNEKSTNKYDELNRTIIDEIKLIGLSEKNLKIICENKEFEVFFKKIRPYLDMGNNFLFFDQYGLKYFSKEVLQLLSEFLKTDFLVFLSSSYVNRFDFPEYLPGFKIDRDHEDYFHIHQNLLDYYRTWVPNGSDLRLYPFSLKKEKSGNIYGLIFGTRSLRGVEKFLNVAWKISSENGNANFDIECDLPKRQEELFEPRRLTKIEAFEKELRDKFCSEQSFSNEDVYLFTLDRGHPPSHGKDILIKMRNEGILEHFSYPKINYKQIYTEKNRVNFRVKNGR